MRIAFMIVAATFCLMGAAVAQSVDDPAIPRGIGNHANGFDYQPTPREVIPREKATGVRPSAISQEKTNRELEEMDRDLLRKEGLGTSSVPAMTPR
jgi:hypothetical protein